MTEEHDDAILARYQQLVAIDDAIGLRATNERLRRDLEQARERIAELEAELVAIRESRTWKAGRVVARLARLGR